MSRCHRNFTFCGCRWGQHHPLRGWRSISHLLTHSWGTQRSMWNIHLERKSCEPSGHQGSPHWTGHLEPVKQKGMNWKGIKGNEDILQEKPWIPLLEGEAERVHSSEMCLTSLENKTQSFWIKETNQKDNIALAWKWLEYLYDTLPLLSSPPVPSLNVELGPSLK